MFRNERQSDGQETQFTNLYVKNLDPRVTQDEFLELFARFGYVTSAVIQAGGKGSKSRFGFVNYDDHEDAQKAVDALHGTDLKGKKLYVARALKKAEREEELHMYHQQAKEAKLSSYDGRNLYLKNLEVEVDDERLRAEFEPYGTITSCKVMKDANQASKGFGFVCFSSPDDATKAKAEMNNKMIGTKLLYVSFAQRREVRRQQLESQIAQRNQIRVEKAAAPDLHAGYMNAPMYYPPQVMPPRPQYLPAMPLPGPYPQDPPQGRGMPSNYPQSDPRIQGAPGHIQSHTVALPARNGYYIPPLGGISSATLNHDALMEQKQRLGEIIYMKVAPYHPELAGRITGILLEMNTRELIYIVEAPDAMNAKVNEALAVLHGFTKDDT